MLKPFDARWRSCRGFIATISMAAVASLGCESRIEIAERLATAGRYQDAYEVAASALVNRALRINLPDAPEKGDEVAGWFAASIFSLTVSFVAKTEARDAQRAVELIGSTRAQLSYVELSVVPMSFAVSLDRYLEKWRETYFPRQKALPRDVVEEATKAFEQDLSIVTLDASALPKGWRSDGVLYSFERGYVISADNVYTQAMLLPPGKWVAVIRTKKKGETRPYAASFIAVPPKPSIAHWTVLPYDEAERALGGVPAIPGISVLFDNPKYADQDPTWPNWASAVDPLLVLVWRDVSLGFQKRFRD